MDEPEDPELIQLQAAMQATVMASLLTMRSRNPTISPIVVAAEIFGWIAAELADKMPPEGVRYGMLCAFEAMHPKAMTFIDHQKAKDYLVKTSAARRQIEAREAGLIIPGGAT